MIRAVIFDLDDTLISERDYIESGYRHVSKVLKKWVNNSEKEIFERLLILFSFDSRNVFNRLLDELHYPYTSEFIYFLVNEYRNHLPTIQFYNDVIPCLERLKYLNIKTGIITDGFENTQKRKMESLNADHLFDVVIYTDELGSDFWKPHPLAFEMMKERLEVDYHEMIYIGDNPSKDFYIKKFHPVNTIRIHRDGIYNHRSYLEGIKADYEIKSLAELPSIISSMNSNA